MQGFADKLTTCQDDTPVKELYAPVQTFHSKHCRLKAFNFII